MHVPFVAFSVGASSAGLGPFPTDHALLSLTVVLAASALQLRHSLAVAAGMRPRFWRWTLSLLWLLVYAALPALGPRMFTLQWYVVASAAMLLPPRVATAAVAATALVGGVGLPFAWTGLRGGAMALAYECVYGATILLAGGGSLYGSVRLVALRDAVRATRAGVAELAVARERQRVSRDLHDLLGQSLTAVALKGELAMRLLARGDRERAAAEIDGLVAAARAALCDTRQLAHREPPVSLGAELARAAELLAAVGVEPRIAVRATPAPLAAELFAWTVREGITNVLRHSNASMCSITVERRPGALRLEIVNDGAPGPAEAGHGLRGVAERATARGAAAAGRYTGGGRFRLHVELPEGAS